MPWPIIGHHDSSRILANPRYLCNTYVFLTYLQDICVQRSQHKKSYFLCRVMIVPKLSVTLDKALSSCNVYWKLLNFRELVELCFKKCLIQNVWVEGYYWRVSARFGRFGRVKTYAEYWEGGYWVFILPKKLIQYARFKSVIGTGMDWMVCFWCTQMCRHQCGQTFPPIHSKKEPHKSSMSCHQLFPLIGIQFSSVKKHRCNAHNRSLTKEVKHCINTLRAHFEANFR